MIIRRFVLQEIGCVRIFMSCCKLIRIDSLILPGNILLSITILLTDQLILFLPVINNTQLFSLLLISLPRLFLFLTFHLIFLTLFLYHHKFIISHIICRLVGVLLIVTIIDIVVIYFNGFEIFFSPGFIAF